MSRLILIKHAAPQVIPGTPPESWHLSEKGKTSCASLAERIRPHSPELIISSDELKAIETAELLAGSLQIPHRIDASLREHDRSNVPHMRSSEFISMMELFFRRPDELVLGRESANEVEDRIGDAIEGLIDSHPAKTIAIVSHGTALALYLATHLNRPAFELWRSLGLPSFVVLDWPEVEIIEVATQIV